MHKTLLSTIIIEYPLATESNKTNRNVRRRASDIATQKSNQSSAKVDQTPISEAVSFPNLCL